MSKTPSEQTTEIIVAAIDSKSLGINSISKYYVEIFNTILKCTKSERIGQKVKTLIRV